jgi:hypothetical protein
MNLNRRDFLKAGNMVAGAKLHRLFGIAAEQHSSHDS